jgi:hypothetical protein
MRIPNSFRRFILFCALTAVVSTASWAWAEVVFVEGASKGSGLTRLRGNTCYVVTAAHLVVRQNGDTVFRSRVVGPGNRPATATIAQPPNGNDDIVILRIEGEDGLTLCKEPWPDLTDFSYLNRGDWQAQFAGPDGGYGRVQFTLSDNDTRFLYFKTSGDDNIFEGLSGSVVRTGDRPVAVASWYRIEEGRRILKAYRLDYVDALIRSFFDAGADWQKLPAFGNPVSAIEVYNGRLFVATLKDGVYRLDDTSRKWQDVSDTARGRNVVTLHSVGVNLYAGYDSSGTQQSGLAVFYMDKWIDIGLTNWLVHAMANSGSRLDVGGYGGYFTGINPATVGGLGAVIAGLPPGAAINALEIVSGSVFAGLGPNQPGQRDTLFVLNREGTQWSNVPAVVDQDIHCLVASGEYLFLGTTTGIGRLNTMDMRFAVKSNGLPENYVVQALAVNGNRIYAGLDGGGVWVSTDAGENWANLNNPELRNEAVLSLKVRNGSELYVGTRSGKVFVLAI